MAAPVFFKLTFPTGQTFLHASTWFGSLDNASAFAASIKMMFWNDAKGIGIGICQPASWWSYQQAMVPLAISEKQAVVQITEFEAAQAVDPRTWSF